MGVFLIVKTQGVYLVRDLTDLETHNAQYNNILEYVQKIMRLE